MTKQIKNRAVFTLNLPGATPGFAGAVRHVLTMLAKDPQVVKGGLFFQLPGSLRDRLTTLGMPEGLAPEFTGVVQHLGVARLNGRGKATVWHLLDPIFLEEFLKELWIIKAFEVHLERADLLEEIRDLKDRKGRLTIETVSLVEKTSDYVVKDQLRTFFVRMFRDFHDPSRGAGLFLTNKIEAIFAANFTFDLKIAIGWLVEEGFLSIAEKHPKLVWKGPVYPEETATVSHLKLAGG